MRDHMHVRTRAGALNSMTGYGAATVPIPQGRLTVEVRTVNQRFLDLRVTAPREYAAWEPACRELVRTRVARGRAEVSVHRQAPARARARVVLDLEAARDYAAAWRKLAHELGLRGEPELAQFQIPEVFRTVEQPLDAASEFPAATRALTLALARLAASRRQEGRVLARDMRGRLDRLAAIERAIRARAGTYAAESRARLVERMRKILADTTIDEARIAQEAAYLAERSDVTEELVRLASHLAALRPLLASGEPVGKQIEFLLQEVHREINTIGSKVNNLEVTRLVVEAKGEVERLREQVQNVE